MLRHRGEAGETLAELLVSVAILGILAVGVVGALASDIIVSRADRDTSTSEAVTRSFSAYLTRTLGSSTGYRTCNAGSTSNPYYGSGTGKWTSSSLGYAPPSGYSATVTGWASNGGVSFWNGTSGRPGDTGSAATAQFSGTCPSSGNGGDQGLQQLSIRVATTGGTGIAIATIQVREP